MVYLRYTPVKLFEVGLQWDRNIYIYTYVYVYIYIYIYIYIHTYIYINVYNFYIYIYVSVYKPRVLGVFDKYTTPAQGQRKFATDKPLAQRARGLSVANFR